MTLPAVRPSAEAESGGEEREVRGVEAGPGERDASGGGERGSEEDAEAQVARGEPRSGELAEEEGGEEGSGLSVLKLPPRMSEGSRGPSMTVTIPEAAK